MLGGDQALTNFIRETIRRDGPVSFAWFMEQALYHPEFGYYSSGRCQIGRRGDYFTNVSVGPLFGRLLAEQFAEMWEMLGRPEDFAIVEQGAHHGDFAKDVLAAAQQRTPEFFAELRYRIIEPFPILRQRQAATLADFRDKVTWEKSIGDLAPFCGVHFSNELLDAMPVHLICREPDSDEWLERCVGESNEGLTFVTKPIGNENLRRQMEKIPGPLAPTYETEVNLAALDWVEEVAGKLSRGFILTVDYGYSRDRFYAPERTSGTLQCYAEQRTVTSPLQNIGHADISAHVDWTSVVERAEKCGLTLTGFTDQHHFITGLLPRMAIEENERRALQTLLHPELLGTRFQFLALGKGAPATQLSGFSFAREPRRAVGL
ncbi:MAG TPA: SAM-dependent methyltransferase [Chthoniobacterales bacterium]